MKKLSISLRYALLPTLVVAMSTLAQTPMPPKQMPASSAPMRTNAAEYLRGSDLIGMDVSGAESNNIGEVNDLIVDISTGAVRYVMFEYDPSVLSTGKVYAVPTKSLALSKDGQNLHFATMSRAQLDRVATDKKEWRTALANSRYLDLVDTAYGVKPSNENANLQRASDLIGRDVSNRAGADIGDIKGLIVDMQTSKVRYAVLAFDPSIFSAEKLFAFPLTAFKPGRDRNDLTLDVDRKRLEAMRSFDTKAWSTMTDIRSIEVNEMP